MSELVIAEKNDLVNIANEIRQLKGMTFTKGLWFTVFEEANK